MFKSLAKPVALVASKPLLVFPALAVALANFVSLSLTGPAIGDLVFGVLAQNAAPETGLTSLRDETAVLKSTRDKEAKAAEREAKASAAEAAAPSNAAKPKTHRSTSLPPKSTSRLPTLSSTSKTCL